MWVMWMMLVKCVGKVCARVWVKWESILCGCCCSGRVVVGKVCECRVGR